MNLLEHIAILQHIILFTQLVFTSNKYFFLFKFFENFTFCIVLPNFKIIFSILISDFLKKKFALGKQLKFSSQKNLDNKNSRIQ